MTDQDRPAIEWIVRLSKLAATLDAAEDSLRAMERRLPADQHSALLLRIAEARVQIDRLQGFADEHHVPDFPPEWTKPADFLPAR